MAQKEGTGAECVLIFSKNPKEQEANRQKVAAAQPYSIREIYRKSINGALTDWEADQIGDRTLMRLLIIWAWAKNGGQPRKRSDWNARLKTLLRDMFAPLGLSDRSLSRYISPKNQKRE